MEESSTYQYIVSKGVAKGKLHGDKGSPSLRPKAIWSTGSRDSSGHRGYR